MIFYINTVNTITLPLSILFNKSIMERQYPPQWKKSIIIPIFKSGNKSLVSNYRPISILSACAKIFDRIMSELLVNQTRHIISTKQHGFVAGKSTLTNLLEYSNFLHTSIMKGRQADAIYTDFEKAFDKINHYKMYDKLLAYNIDPGLAAWLLSYMVGRQHCLALNGAHSSNFESTSGLPQGGIISSALFLLYINDLSKKLTVPHLMYADDLKLFMQVRSERDCMLIQENLDVLNDWCRCNDININIGKCCVVSFTHKPTRTRTTYTYKIDGNNITRKTEIRDLGIIFDQKLSFEPHINHITQQAYKTIGFIFRTTQSFTNAKAINILYHSLVRTKLEYCCQIWNPYYQSHEHTLERIQKKFTRWVFYRQRISYQPYNLRLQTLKMISLADRRTMLEEITLYKLINNNLSTTLVDKLIRHEPSRRTRHTPTFYIPSCSTNIEHNAPIYRMQRNHNDIFSDVDIFNVNLQALKTHMLDKFGQH